mmetsp:Transcript_30560/g.83983  ORF Transcript_30560/g.83983 Transcript_30560/m.83983 type:complete len:430 (-) Transcript_30560:2214-3503(-)
MLEAMHQCLHAGHIPSPNQLWFVPVRAVGSGEDLEADHVVQLEVGDTEWVAERARAVEDAEDLCDDVLPQGLPVATANGGHTRNDRLGHVAWPPPVHDALQRNLQVDRRPLDDGLPRGVLRQEQPAGCYALLWSLHLPARRLGREPAGRFRDEPPHRLDPSGPEGRASVVAPRAPCACGHRKRPRSRRGSRRGEAARLGDQVAYLLRHAPIHTDLVPDGRRSVDVGDTADNLVAKPPLGIASACEVPVGRALGTGLGYVFLQPRPLLHRVHGISESPPLDNARIIGIECEEKVAELRVRKLLWQHPQVNTQIVVDVVVRELAVRHLHAMGALQNSERDVHGDPWRQTAREVRGVWDGTALPRLPDPQAEDAQQPVPECRVTPHAHAPLRGVPRNAPEGADREYPELNLGWLLRLHTQGNDLPNVAVFPH